MGLIARSVAVLALALSGATALTLDCAGGSEGMVSIDDVIFKEESVCEQTCGGCSGSSGGMMTCAPSAKSGEFRCAEPDASSMISMAIVSIPSTELSCDDVTSLKFEEGCDSACASCSLTCVRNTCKDFETPQIAVDPKTRTAVDATGAVRPEMKTITFD